MTVLIKGMERIVNITLGNGVLNFLQSNST